MIWSFSLQKYLLRYYSSQDKNDEINASFLKNTKAIASGKNLRLYMQYQRIIRRIRIPSLQISSVHCINISKSIRARLGANRRDKNGNIRRLSVAAARYPYDVNGFIISRRQRRTNSGDRHRMYLARDGTKSREEIGKLLERGGRETRTVPLIRWRR